MRTIICHYHIYKNSGTSFDLMLAQNYGESHICFDGPFPFFSIDQEQLSRVIERKINIVAFSSHQIQLPVPASLDYLVLPVVFVRHPLLRILSIYRFKRQVFDGTSTSKAAQDMSFDEWLTYCFSDRQEVTHVSNAQTRLLGAAYRQKPLIRRRPHAMEYDVHQAIRNIESVKLLARTELFDQDVGRFPEILRKYGIEFDFVKVKPQNTTTNNHDKSINELLYSVKKLISERNYQKLSDANEQDLVIYEHASNIIEQTINPGVLSSV